MCWCQKKLYWIIFIFFQWLLFSVGMMSVSLLHSLTPGVEPLLNFQWSSSHLCNIAVFIIICQKPFCHTNGRVIDIVSRSVLSWYQLYISCLCYKTFVISQWGSFIGNNNGAEVWWCTVKTITSPTKQMALEDKKDWWDEMTFQQQINLWSYKSTLI